VDWFLRELEANPHAWDIVTFEDASKAPAGFTQLVPLW
jgi:hypothetical protein